MRTVCSENDCVLFLQGQVHIIDLPRIRRIRRRYVTIPVTHKSRGRLRRINFRINNAISWAGIHHGCPSCCVTDLPFVGNESRMDLVNLVILEHWCILIKYARLGEVWSWGVWGRHSVGGGVHSLKTVTSD
jgi:hypothetical protein